MKCNQHYVFHVPKWTYKLWNPLSYPSYIIPTNMYTYVMFYYKLRCIKPDKPLPNQPGPNISETN